MAHPKPGDKAPLFDLPAADGDDVALGAFLGKQPIVLLFYPGDFTPVCTKEMCEVRDSFHELSRLDAAIFGISTDALESHQRFRDKHRLPFKLLTDATGHVAKRYGALGLLGRAKRATFVIDKQGVIRYANVQLPFFRPSIQEIAKVLSALQQKESAGAGGPTDDRAAGGR